jgi:DNA-directed RNA polymerase specialized sigma24 family protein
MVEGDPIVLRLIEEARRQSPGALDRLLKSYRNNLRLLARTGIDSSRHGKADPSALVQETLLKAHQHFEQFRVRPRPS